MSSNDVDPFLLEVLKNGLDTIAANEHGPAFMRLVLDGWKVRYDVTAVDTEEGTTTVSSLRSTMTEQGSTCRLPRPGWACRIFESASPRSTEVWRSRARPRERRSG